MESIIGMCIGSNMIALIILLIRRLLRKYLSKRFAYAMWILIPMFMLIFPFVKVPAPKFVQNATVTVRDWADVATKETVSYSGAVGENTSQQMVTDKTDSAETMSVTGAETADAADKTIQNKERNLTDILVKSYVAIAFICLLAIVYINLKFILQCRRNRTWREKSFGLGLAVYELAEISSPFLFGRSIYVPVHMTEEEMRYGTLHEEYHYRHWDSIWVVVRYLMLAIHFYSPIMWVAFRCSGYDCELACDEAVMERIDDGERRNYGRCLLQIMENSKYRTAGLLSTNMKSGKSLIKERIKVIASEPKSSISIMMVVVAFMLVVVSWMLLEKTTEVASRIEAANLPQESVEQTGALEESDASEDTQPIILRTNRVGQYYSTTSASPWIVEDPEGTLFGYTDDVYVEGGPEPKEYGPRFALEATASSELDPQGENYYDAMYAAIPSRDATWAEGVVGDGIGEYVEIQQMQEAYKENTIDGKLYFDEICIVTGYAKNETIWKKNNRAKTLNFYFEDEYVGVIELEDIMLPQYIDISNLDLCVLNGEVANFRFEILDVYEGDVYEDTCITGVDFKFREPK